MTLVSAELKLMPPLMKHISLSKNHGFHIQFCPDLKKSVLNFIFIDTHISAHTWKVSELILWKLSVLWVCRKLLSWGRVFISWWFSVYHQHCISFSLQDNFVVVAATYGRVCWGTSLIFLFLQAFAGTQPDWIFSKCVYNSKYNQVHKCVLNNKTHLISKVAFPCQIAVRRVVPSGQHCVRAISPKDWHLALSYPGQNLQEKHSPLQLKPTLVRHPASRRGLPGSSRPVPPIPRLASPLPSRAQGRAEQCEDAWLNEAGRKLAADLSELSVDDEDVDQEEVCLCVIQRTFPIDRL